MFHLSLGPDVQVLQEEIQMNALFWLVFVGP